MFYGNPRINNGDGVYNGGGGGGGGTFNVDIGGGVSQELTFPPYLVPVEYIDTSNVTGNFAITGGWKHQLNNSDELKVKTAFVTSKVSSGGDRILTSELPLGDSASNAYIILTVTSNKSVFVNYGNVGTGITGTNLHVDDYILIDYKNQTKTLLVKDGFGNSQTDTSTNSYNNYKQAMWGVFGLTNQTPQTFHGKFFYSYIKNNGAIIALWIPARLKENDIGEPYIVECVSGTVGINKGNQWSTSGIAFGPDIDLSDIGNYFQ